MAIFLLTTTKLFGSGKQSELIVNRRGKEDRNEEGNRNAGPDNRSREY
jgi:glycerol-3-phosphate acyltransferase PlsY